MRKAIKKPFKPPIQAKDKIDKILGKASLSQKGKAAETVDNDLNDSVCTTSTGISSRLNEPAIKKMYMDFTVNMSKQIISSTPLPSSQDVKDDDLANMSFKDHMLNVLNNSEPIGMYLCVSDEEQKKDNCETSVSLSQTDNEDFDFMKNFKNTKPNKKIFSSFEMNEKDEQKKKTVEKGKRNESKVDKPEQIKEFAGNKESTPKEVTEKNKKQRKPRVQKKKTPEENKAKEKESLKKLETGKGNVSSKQVANEQQILVCNNSLYDLGTVVWAKIEGYPWWPAMVDDDPDFGTHIWVEEGSKEPTWYHVAFFDTQVVTRAWVQPDRISAYNMPIITPNKCQKMYAARLKGSIKQAEQALEMSWSGRIAKYGFVVRYPHGVGDLQKEREKKQRQDKIKEEKRQRRKKIYLELLKKKVAKSHKNDERKKKKSLLRLYSTGVGEELQNCVDSMFNLQGKQGNIDEITEMLEMEIQNDIVSSNSQENISETSIDMLETAN
nr:unnamed protein product [Callosobruchus chinensis]